MFIKITVKILLNKTILKMELVRRKMCNYESFVKITIKKYQNKNKDFKRQVLEAR